MHPNHPVPRTEGFWYYIGDKPGLVQEKYQDEFRDRRVYMAVRHSLKLFAQQSNWPTTWWNILGGPGGMGLAGILGFSRIFRVAGGISGAEAELWRAVVSGWMKRVDETSTLLTGFADLDLHHGILQRGSGKRGLCLARMTRRLQIGDEGAAMGAHGVGTRVLEVAEVSGFHAEQAQGAGEGAGDFLIRGGNRSALGIGDVDLDLGDSARGERRGLPDPGADGVGGAGGFQHIDDLISVLDAPDDFEFSGLEGKLPFDESRGVITLPGLADGAAVEMEGGTGEIGVT